jgi:D-galacturonate reductase
LTLLDLRLRGVVGPLHLAGTSGGKLPAIRAHLSDALRVNYPGSPFDMSMSTYPNDGTTDALAYRTALATMPVGSAVTIFTPDDTHFSIAMDCVEAGMHVLVTKPIVMTLAQHHTLMTTATRKNVLVTIEVHKRWDPIYSDARDRLRRLGDCSQLHAYMSQPKLQLETFRAWAGLSSDISYYLNSHHVDFHEWVMAGGRGRPERVTALASTGIAEKVLGRPCEDTITLAVEWTNFPSRTKCIATYTASWAAPKGDVHSQQRFFAMAHEGEVTVDQAHRGYQVATDAAGFASPNPLFMRYTPDSAGRFAGQSGYGYKSIELFVRAAAAITAGTAKVSDFNEELATIHGTLQGSAILEAGRRSLDSNGAPIRIVYKDENDCEPEDLEVWTNDVK